MTDVPLDIPDEVFEAAQAKAYEWSPKSSSVLTRAVARAAVEAWERHRHADAELPEYDCLGETVAEPSKGVGTRCM